MQESFNSSLQFSESHMSDLSDNSSFSFCKLNANINDDSLSSSSDDADSVGNRSVTVSNKIGSIECKIDEMHDDIHQDSNGFVRGLNLGSRASSKAPRLSSHAAEYVLLMRSSFLINSTLLNSSNMLRKGIKSLKL